MLYEVITSWHAGLVAEYLIEEYARVPVEVEYASEFRYRKPIINPGDVVIVITSYSIHYTKLYEHQFGCRGLTYWFDDERKTAFCLIEAPSAEKLKEMHDHAHGEVPHRIIEVEPAIVESFLGRIEDPVKAKDTRLNIINEPAFRIIMAVEQEMT